jgi:tetratricopeptide (TPR) repeat protein
MYFENNTGNKEMDWLRTGLTDMLVTDLSQSPDVEVLSTDRLVQILGAMNKLDDRQISFDTVQEVARRAGVRHVMLGSFIKAGEAIRINVKLQDATSGRIISTERVDAVNEASLFPTMDDLTRRVKARFAESSNVLTGLLSRPGSKPGLPLYLDRDLKDVTTSSMEAYREYAAGVEQNQRSRYQDALPHFEKAVSIDPTFALAYAKMAVGAGNMGRSNERDRYAERALALVDRLTPRERLYIEGYYNSSTVETTGKAIDAYSKLLELYPDHSASRNNVAVLLLRTDQFDKAIEHYELLRERGFEFPGAVANMAVAYVTADRPEDALSVTREFTSRYPLVEAGHLNLGTIALSLNRLDEAKASLEKSLALRPNFPPAVASIGVLHLVRDEFAEARQIGQQLLKAPAPNVRSLGWLQLIYADLYQGRTMAAAKQLARAVDEQGPAGSNESAGMRTIMAEISRAHQRREEAAAHAQRAIADARGRLSVLDGLFQGAVAGSAQIRSDYGRIAATLPAGVDKVLPELADAILSIEDGRHAEALPMLQRVSPHVPPGVVWAGAVVPIRQPRTRVAYWTARAQLAGGNDVEAAQRFKSVVDAGWGRLFTPIEYIRSFYYLGQIAERSGDRNKAREYYGRFLKYWKDGDIDRDKVQDALKKTGS